MTTFIDKILTKILNHFSVDNRGQKLVRANSFISQDISPKPRGKT